MLLSPHCPPLFPYTTLFRSIDKLRAYAQSGGMLFTHADGGDSAFDQYVEKNLSPKLFPKYEIQDVPANDPIYSVQYHMKPPLPDRKSTRLNSSHLGISYAVF